MTQDETVETGMTSETGLSAEHLAKTYRGKQAVSDISIRLGRGETVALLGPNGAGKTTLISMITGVRRPDMGRISIDGVDVTGHPVHTRARLGLSYLPQETSVFRGLSVEDNIMLYLEAVEPDRRARRARLELLIGEFGLEDCRRQNATRLSGGQRRRCEIARALAADPNYVLLDEPFAGVDPLAISYVQSMIRTLRDRGLGVLVSDHNVRETLSIVDRAYIMESGRVLAKGSPEEVVANELVRRHYLGSDFNI